MAKGSSTLSAGGFLWAGSLGLATEVSPPERCCEDLAVFDAAKPESLLFDLTNQNQRVQTRYGMCWELLELVLSWQAQLIAAWCWAWQPPPPQCLSVTARPLNRQLASLADWQWSESVQPIVVANSFEARL